MTELVAHSIFGEIAALLVLAAAAGFIGILLHQPLIVSFIAVGIMAGPAALNIVRSNDPIELLSELGIAILLFLVGVKLDVKLVRSLGAVALTTGLGQVVFTSAFGFLIGLALGFDAVASLYIAVALTFSSTIIIVKLLSDKREIDSLHGKVALGFLIVQDLVVVLAMIVLAATGIGAGADGGIGGVLRALGSGALLLMLVVVFVRYLAEPLTARLARAPELLITFAIGQAAMFAAVGDHVGLGKEVGGLLAGVSLASTPYRDAIAARMAPLRDFLLLFFFIALGSRLDLSLLGANLPAAAIFSAFVLVGNPLVVLAIMGAMGFRKRTGFLAGLTVAQISEFSLIFVAMGVSLGHVGQEALGLVTLVGLVTIAASTYMITYSHELYALCEPALGAFERRSAWREERGDGSAGPAAPDVVLLGLGRFGAAIARRLIMRGLRVLAVDFNPDVVLRARRRGLAVAFGDATDPEFLRDLPRTSVGWIVCTVPAQLGVLGHEDPRHAILRTLRAAGFRGKIAFTAHGRADGESILAAGADLALEPFQDAADRAVELLTGSGEPRTADPRGGRS